jgi:Mn-dependent DtxR family transcriptional regulator
VKLESWTISAAILCVLIAVPVTIAFLHAIDEERVMRALYLRQLPVGHVTARTKMSTPRTIRTMRRLIRFELVRSVDGVDFELTPAGEKIVRMTMTRRPK